MKLQELVTECAKNNIGINVEYNKLKERLEYRIQIGSKTGNGMLYESEGKILLETRYNTLNEIESFDDIAEVAFTWFDNYKDREPFNHPDSDWAHIFESKGWITSEVVTVYKTNRT